METTEKQSPIATVSSRKINSTYGYYSEAPLLQAGYIKALPRERGKALTFELLQELPTKEKLEELRRTCYTRTIGDAVEEAYGIIQELGEEMRNWHDNMPESLQSSEKGENISSAADELENNADAPEVPESVADIKEVYVLGNASGSRSNRLSFAINLLQQVNDSLEGIKSNNDSARVNATEEEIEAIDEQDGEIDELLGTLGDAVDALENIEFPGMY